MILRDAFESLAWGFENQLGFIPFTILYIFS